MQKRRFIPVRKTGVYLTSYPLDVDIVYKITNVSNNRFFIRNAHIVGDVKHKISVISIPKFEKMFFKINTIVRVEKFGQINNKGDVELFTTQTNGDTSI